MSFLCNGSPGYDWQKKVTALEPGAYKHFREQTGLVEQLPNVNSEENLKKVWLHDLLMDEGNVEAWNAIGVEITMRKVKGLASNATKLPDIVYQISVANVGLMSVTRVDVLEDCCTDNLQTYLDRGWRILAVCPPNDTRRPTYIVGHTNPPGDPR